MSKIEVTYKDNILKIEKQAARKNNSNIELIQTNILEFDKEYDSNIRITNMKENNKVFFLQEIDEEKNVIVVYSNKNKIKYSYCNKERAYKKLVQLRFRVLKLSFTKRKLKIKVLAYIVNKYNMEITNTKFYIDSFLNKECKLKQYKDQISKWRMLEDRNVYTFKFDIEDIVKSDSLINGIVRFSLNIQGDEIPYQIGIFDKKIKNKRYYYAPIRSKYVKDFAIHIRRTPKGNLVLVKRLKEPIENTFKFRFMESKIISNTLYGISKILLKVRKKKINLFYEKFSSKAEEGAYDLFLKIRDNSKKTKNYFVIDKESKDYKKIKNQKNVVKKYSLKYYWLIFNVSNFISTEAPIHLNILRSNNSALRKSTCDKKFIFLQHGVTYMKCQGDGSTFAKDKEGEATYIVVGSEKEKDAVVDMLMLNEEQVLNTGLPIFSKVDYNHINDESEDIITIMLTWKPYEEQLYSFDESTYYKNIIDIYNILTKYIDKEKILIVPHPKVYNLLVNTDMKNNMWLDKISEVLVKTKMLITDYSSVCYNSFYQGAGVVFYQEDLEKYETENGKLIPNDDEYIGKRAFNLNELENIVKDTIIDGKINLSGIRTKEHEENYKTINEFTDGKNIDRIYEELVKLGLV